MTASVFVRNKYVKLYSTFYFPENMYRTPEGEYMSKEEIDAKYPTHTAQLKTQAQVEKGVNPDGSKNYLYS